jgi:excisionase family DNA binding protein
MVETRKSNQLLLTVPETADALSVSRSKAYVLMNEGLLPYVIVGATRRIRQNDLAKFVEDLNP